MDQAHRHGLAVILDVVYNHLGPDGNYLKHFSPDYFTDRHGTDWGEAINFDGPGSGPVREFYLANARAWIEEFHFDGLRLDATQSIFDESPEHILAGLGARGARGGPGPLDAPRRGERASARAPGTPDRPRGSRPRCALERRPAP